jgi:hypothetical protein
MGGFMTFKEQRELDIAATFLNTDEFAELLQVRYNGRDYNIPVVIDNDEERDRARAASDNAVGVFTSAVRAFISFEDLGILPNKNTQITIDSERYDIMKSVLESGMITLELECYDE